MEVSDMANKKKPFATYETKELFDKHYNFAYESGREQGFKEGKAWALSYIYDLFDFIFSPEDTELALLEKKHRHIEEWRKTKEYRTLKDQLDLQRLIHDVGEKAKEQGWDLG